MTDATTAAMMTVLLLLLGGAGLLPGAPGLLPVPGGAFSNWPWPGETPGAGETTLCTGGDATGTGTGTGRGTGAKGREGFGAAAALVQVGAWASVAVPRHLTHLRGWQGAKVVTHSVWRDGLGISALAVAHSGGRACSRQRGERSTVRSSCQAAAACCSTRQQRLQRASVRQAAAPCIGGRSPLPFYRSLAAVVDTIKPR
jgi:hypothetical protein